MKEDLHLTFFSVREPAAAQLSWDFIKAAEAHQKENGNLHSFMSFLVGS